MLRLACPQSDLVSPNTISVAAPGKVLSVLRGEYAVPWQERSEAEWQDRFVLPRQPHWIQQGPDLSHWPHRASL